MAQDGRLSIYKSLGSIPRGATILVLLVDIYMYDTLADLLSTEQRKVTLTRNNAKLFQNDARI